MESIVLGGGCFWCLEASYQLINGVTKVVSGYAGGSEKDAEYYTVSGGQTNHVEVVQVTFNTNVIELPDVLDIFWAIHDPTSIDRQGNDAGPQYRSAIFYQDEDQHEIVDKSIDSAQKLWDKSIVTVVSKLEKFYPAEDNHQNYFKNNPEQAYCQVIINPKLAKLRQKFADRISD